MHHCHDQGLDLEEWVPRSQPRATDVVTKPKKRSSMPRGIDPQHPRILLILNSLCHCGGESKGSHKDI